MTCSRSQAHSIPTRPSIKHRVILFKIVLDCDWLHLVAGLTPNTTDASSRASEADASTTSEASHADARKRQIAHAPSLAAPGTPQSAGSERRKVFGLSWEVLGDLQNERWNS